MEYSPSWEAKSSSASQEIPHILWERKVHYRIHNSQLATRLYSEPDQSSPCPPHPTSWRSILIFFSHLRLGPSSGLCHSGFPIKPCTHLSSPPYVLHAPPLSASSVWLSEYYLVRNTDQWTPNYEVFATPPLPRPSWAQIFSSPYSQTPSTYVLLSMWATKLHTHTKQQAKLQFYVS